MEENIQSGRVNIDGVYYVRLENHNYVLCKSRISNGEKTKGQEVEYVIGYYSDFENLFNRYFKECVVNRSIGLTMELNDFIKLIKEIKEEIKEIRKVIEC